MRVMQYARGTKLDDAEVNYIKGRVSFALSRFGDLISKVDVYIDDENDKKGEINKSCIVRIRMDQFSDLVIKDIGSDLYTVVARALSRSKQALIHQITRSQSSYYKGFLKKASIH